jgi:hypothetical protein
MPLTSFAPAALLAEPPVPLQLFAPVATKKLTESHPPMPIRSAHVDQVTMKTQVEGAFLVPSANTALLAHYLEETWSAQAVPALTTGKRWAELATARPGIKKQRAPPDPIAKRELFDRQ